MTGLPDTVAKYSQSRVFTEETTPANFQKHHETRPGVWGNLVVARGAIIFEWEQGDRLNLVEGDSVVIPPETPHRVVLTGPVGFYVEFYR